MEINRELRPEFMEPMQTARFLTTMMDADLLQASYFDFPQKMAFWRCRIGDYQHGALRDREMAEQAYVRGSPVYVAYHLSFKYAMRTYSRCKAQLIFWGEGGKGLIPLEAECHRN